MIQTSAVTEVSPEACVGGVSSSPLMRTFKKLQMRELVRQEAVWRLQPGHGSSSLISISYQPEDSEQGKYSSRVSAQC